MSAINLRQLSTRDAGVEREFTRLLDRAQVADPKVEATVKEIIADVRARGDAALLDYTRRFDRRELAAAAELEIPRQRLREAARALSKEQYEALANAAERIRAYHERQRTESWRYTEPDGT